MRIELASFLQAATGPYGGRTAGTKLVTRQDGTILVTARKTAMTGDHVHPVHAWARVIWIYVDALWKSLPRRIRAEWGLCARRTTDKASSNLDEFRHVNMPRALLGMPMLRLPPDRSKSQAMYLPPPDTAGRHSSKAPTQLWIEGVEKPEPPWTPTPDEPEPPWPGPDPPPPAEFDVNKGPFGHPLVASASCYGCPCPDDVPYCYDELYVKPPVDFLARPGSDYFLWKAYTPPDRSYRTPVWDIQTEIWSERRWYDNVPYERLIAENVACYADTYEGVPLPFGSAYCVKLTHYSSPGMKLSYAYYWQFSTELCPHGYFELAWTFHIYGDYHYPESLTLERGGDVITEPPPCFDPGGILLQDEHPSTVWLDNSATEMWAGYTWDLTGPRKAWPRPELCAGPAYLNVSDIRCCDTEPRKGMWYFQITVLHNGTPYLLEYRKPIFRDDYGIFGTYFIHDPTHHHSWASFGITLQDKAVDWTEFVPDVALECIKEMLIIAMWELLGYAVHWHLKRALFRLGNKAGYSYRPIREAVSASRSVNVALKPGTWKCKLLVKLGPGAMKNRTLALEALRRVRALKHAL